MAAPAKAPDSLKSINIYLKTATEHDARDPVVAYYCRLFAVQRGMEIDKKSPESKGFLLKMMDVLDSAKSSMKDNETISSETVGQCHVENYALKLFSNADKRDRSSDFGPATVKSFYTAGILMDVLAVFGEVGEEIQNIRKYAKWKAIYITNCRKTGETPIAGPIDAEGAPEAPNLDFAGAQPPPAPSVNVTPPQPPPQTFQPPPQTYQPPPQTYQPPVQPSYQPVEPPPPAAPASTPVGGPASGGAAAWSMPATSTGAAGLGPDQYTKGMKYCRYASSALQYQDTKTAIDYLQRALTLLTTGKDED